MLNFLAKRILQLIPTLFFVSVLIFSLQHLLPGDPALVMAGEERDPTVIAANPRAIPARSADPGAICLLGQGRGVRRPRRVAAHQGSGARPDRAKTAGDDATGVDGDRDRLPDRHPGRHRLGGEERHDLGLWRQCLCAVGHLDAEFLARDHADLPVLDRSSAGCRPPATCRSPRTGARALPPPSCRPSCSATPSPRS